MPRRPQPGSPARARVLLTITLASVALLAGGVSIAEACGGFFRAASVAPEKQPSLSREKVLLIHDAKTGQQHFIREVAFQRATEPFGFVVPTPTRPTVAAVEGTPFTKLRDGFPFTPRSRGTGEGSIGLGNTGLIGKGGGGGVEVLAVETVGSFTAFVLAATDAEALSTWLADNQLVSTPEADAWLAHYVDMGFYYVAMRYDPPRPDAGALPITDAVVAETMRISFATPVPYYPYLEPELANPVAKLDGERRLMELWVVGDAPVVPVAVREQAGQRTWVQPLQPGARYANARAPLDVALAPGLSELLPTGRPLTLQTFQDQKTTRPGFQDVLFVSEVPTELTAERRAQLEPLLAILDPSLAPGVSEAKQ